MARPGLNYEDVASAADAQLMDGIRPTIQSLHAALGTGSSSTIHKFLNVWWQQLGPRLANQQLAMVIPDAPEPVHAAAADFWRSALAAANRHLDQHRIDLKASYQKQSEALEAQKVAAAEAVEMANARAANAEATIHTLTTQLGESDAMMTELRRHLDDLRVALQNANDQLRLRDQQVHGLQGALNKAQEAASIENERYKSHIEATENRCAKEIDIARCTARDLASELKEARQGWEARIAKMNADIAHWKSEAASHSARATQVSADLHAAQSIQQSQAERITHLDRQLKDFANSLMKAKKPREDTKTPKFSGGSETLRTKSGDA